MYSGVFAKSVQVLGILLFLPLIYSVWPRIGREGPSVDECKARSHENST